MPALSHLSALTHTGAVAPIPHGLAEVPGQVQPTLPNQAQTSTPPTPAAESENPASTSFHQPRAEKVSCAGNSRSGEPCRGFAHGDAQFCIFHDPAYREAQRANSAKGGRRSGETRARARDELFPIDLTTPQARIEVLGYILAGTLAGRFSQTQATVINRVLSIATRYQEELPFDPVALAELLHISATFRTPPNEPPSPATNGSRERGRG
ncbi:MAG: hypothetical protein AB7N24_01765 [Dehalococcoidia bacterium]